MRKCENYTGITSTFSRIYVRILAILVELEYKNIAMEEQSGFPASQVQITFSA